MEQTEKIRTKEEFLKPKVFECIERLRKLVTLNAPAVIVGAAAWNVYTTILAAYGTEAGKIMINEIRDHNLHSRAVCSYEDCINYVDRPDVGTCEECLRKLGIGDLTPHDLTRENL